MTDQELKEIEARASAATPGPWIVDYDYRQDGADQIVVRVGPQMKVQTIAFMAVGWEDEGANAELLAHSREDIPKLIAALREAKIQISLLGTSVDRLQEAAKALRIERDDLLEELRR